MEISVFLSKFVGWLVYQLLGNSCYKAARKLRNYGVHFFRLSPSTSTSTSTHRSSSPHQNPPPLYPNLPKTHPIEGLSSKTVLVCDTSGGTLVLDPSSSDDKIIHGRDSCSFFPYLMLVAFEAGSIVRAFFLLLSYPLLWALLHSHHDELRLKAMVFITFCGLRVRDVESVGRAVLPKFYLENLNMEVFELLEKAKGKVVITGFPRVMVEGCLKEYLGVDQVVGTELRTVGHFFSGLQVAESGGGGVVAELFGEGGHQLIIPDIGVGTSGFHDSLLLSLCKEAYVVSQSRSSNTGPCRIPRDRYPKPLVFHDGRLAFLPTPMATLAMFMWLPFGILLAMTRLAVGTLLPYNLARLLSMLSGIRLAVNLQQQDDQHDDPTPPAENDVATKLGVLYVCSHRTLLDPVMLSVSLGKPLTAVTYSLSKMSEMIAPLRTVRLTRDRKHDGETMETMLRQGDLVVCPEGTTCREPYLLRFSPLFAELADEIVPVATNAYVTMFYGTTAGGLKCLDPVFFLMNPKPCYYVHVLGKLPRGETCAGGKSSLEVANLIQSKLGDALGFQCTSFTRKDKYMILAGNEGRVLRQRG
ncbi:hypothetical protein Dimus_019518 [Dionaea muscipula]